MERQVRFVSDVVDRLEVKVEAEAQGANKQLDKLVGNLEKVSSSLGAINAGGLQGLANGVQKLSNSMLGIKNVGTADFTRLTKNIGQLGSINAAGLNSAASSMIIMGKSLSGLGKVSENVVQLGELSKSLSKLGNKGVTNAITNIPQLADALNKMMGTLSRSPQVSKNLIQMTNSLANLASQGSKVSSATKSINSSFKSYSSATDRATKSSKSFASAVGMLYARFWMLKRAAQAMFKSVESSMDFLETVNYFEVAVGKIGKASAGLWQENGYNSAEEYANSFSGRLKELTSKMTGFEIDVDGNATMSNADSLGLNPDIVMQNQAVYAQMADSLGLCGETAINTSKAFTMLGADWASLRNISLDTAWEKFASAMAGQSRAVRSLGIDITMATLQETAYKYGLTQAVQEMNQATKAQLRLLTIMNQSTVAFGDMANTIQSPANQLRILQQNFANLSRIIGNLFLPVIAKVLPYINGLVIAMQRLFTWVGGLLGIKFDSINSAIGGAGDGIGDVVGGVGDLEEGLEDANAAAKKLKTTTLGIDELNINAPQEDSGGKDTPVGGGNPILDGAIADALAEYEKVWNDAFNRMDNKAKEIADNIAAYFGKIWDAAENTRIALKNLWNDGLKDLEQFSTDTLKDFYNNFLVPVGKWLLTDNAGLPRLFNVLNKMLTDIEWGTLRNSLYNLYESMADLAIFTFDALFDFVEYFLAPLGTWVMGNALPQLADILSRFIEDLDWEKINISLEKFWKALLPFAQAVGQGIINFFRDLSKIGASFINIVVPGGINALASALELLDPRTIERIAYALSALLTAYLGFKGISKIKGIISGAFNELYSSTVLSGLKNVTTKMMGFAHTIPIVTSALKGNKSAANALATFYPKLNKNIVGVSDAFGTFKANLGSGAFFKNTLTDIRAWGSGLSGVTKSIIGVTAVFAEFNILKNTFEDMALGTENLAVGIGKITVAVGLAVGALKLIGLSNPFTAIIVGINGVIAGLMGVREASEKLKLDEEIKTYGDSVENLTGKFKIANDEIKRKLDETQAYVEGAGAAEARLAQDLSDRYYELAEKANKTNYEKSLMKQYASELVGILPELSGKIDEETGFLTAQKDEVQALVGKTQEYYKLQAAREQIIVAYQNQIIAEKNLLEQNDKAVIAAQNLKDANNNLADAQERSNQAIINGEIDTYADDIANASDMVSKAAVEFSDLSTEAKKASNLFLESSKDVEYITEIMGKSGEAVSAIEFSNLSIKSATAIDEAGGIWDNGKQILGEKALAIQEEVLKGLTPDENGVYTLAEGMTISYGDGAESGIEKAVSTIDKPFLDKLKGMLPEGYSIGEENGKYYVTGFNDGMSKTSKETQDAVNRWCDIDINKATKEGTGVHSPSTITYGFGMNYVFGFNNGILDHIWTTTIAIGIWATRAIEKLNSSFGENFAPEFFETAFSTAVWTEKLNIWFESISPFFTLEKWELLLSNTVLSFTNTWDKISKDTLKQLELMGINISKSIDLQNKTLDIGMQLRLKNWGLSWDNMNSITTKICSEIQKTVKLMSDGVKNECDNVISKLDEVSRKIASIGSGTAKVGVSFSVPQFAGGGFPNTGELFMARENGITEMVGSMGSRASVANNDQIVEGIASGVAYANEGVIAELRQQNALLRELIAKDSVIEMDSREVGKILDSRRNRNGLNFSPA